MRKWAVIFLAILGVLAGATAASAREIQQGDQCVIEADRTIEGNLFVLCRSLTIEGTVTGSVFGAATSATINGTIDGDVYIVAGQLNISGEIGGDIHFGGPILRLYPTATLTDETSNVIAASLSTDILEGATVPGSIIGVGYQLLMRGAVGSEISFWGSALTIDGPVAGDVDAQVGDATADVSQLQTLLIPFLVDVSLVNPGLIVTERGDIDGSLSYSGPTEGQIAPSAAVEEIAFAPVVVQPDFSQLTIGEEDESRSFGLYLSQMVREFLTLVITGVVALVLFPTATQAPLVNLQARPLPSLGVGMLTFILSFVVVPIALLLSVLLFIVISLLQVNELTFVTGLLLGVANVGSAGLLFFIIIFISRVIFCLALGRTIVRLALGADDSPRFIYLSLAVGAALLAVVASLPLVGWVVNAVAAFLGLGAILTLVQARADAAREAPATPRYVSVSAPALPARRVEEVARRPPPPPPISEDVPQRVGMDNLPEGFEWWDD